MSFAFHYPMKVSFSYAKNMFCFILNSKVDLFKTCQMKSNANLNDVQNTSSYLNTMVNKFNFDHQRKYSIYSLHLLN